MNFLAQPLMAGIIIATCGVLFRKALKTAVGAMVRHSAWCSERGRRSTFCTSQWMPPVSSSATATMHSTPTVIMPSLPKPANASLGVRTPETMSRVTAPRNTASAARFVKISVPTMPARIASVSQAAQSMR